MYVSGLGLRYILFLAHRNDDERRPKQAIYKYGNGNTTRLWISVISNYLPISGKFLFIKLLIDCDRWTNYEVVKTTLMYYKYYEIVLVVIFWGSLAFILFQLHLLNKLRLSWCSGFARLCTRWLIVQSPFVGIIMLHNFYLLDLVGKMWSWTSPLSVLISEEKWNRKF